MARYQTVYLPGDREDYEFARIAKRDSRLNREETKVYALLKDCNYYSVFWGHSNLCAYCAVVERMVS